MHRQTILIAFALVFLLTAAACAPLTSAVPTPPAAPPSVANTAIATITSVASGSTSAGEIRVIDSAQRTVVIPRPAERIISLAPSATEIAFALGLGSRMVAVDNHSDYPAEAKALPHFQTYPLNLEQLVSFKPDLVLAGNITSQEEIKKIQDLKLTVLVVGVVDASFDSVFSDIALVGKATGTEANAEQITSAMKEKLNTIRSKISMAKTRPSVYWELDATDPSKPFTPGPGSFIDDLITLAGGKNIAANAKSTWAQLNSEEIVAADPQIIIMSDVPYGISVESLKGRTGWTTIRAVKDNLVFPIDDNLVSRQGPRIVDGLEAAAKLIHPELFQ